MPQTGAPQNPRFARECPQYERRPAARCRFAPSLATASLRSHFVGWLCPPLLDFNADMVTLSGPCCYVLFLVCSSFCALIRVARASGREKIPYANIAPPAPTSWFFFFRIRIRKKQPPSTYHKNLNCHTHRNNRAL